MMDILILVFVGIILFALAFVLGYIDYKQLEKDEVRITRYPKEMRFDKQIEDTFAYTRMSGKARHRYLKDFVPTNNDDYIKYIVTVKDPKGQVIDVVVFYHDKERKEK
jgi:hypothetical protein